ncbi:hypothetical protein EAJ15_06355 [Parabacteroides merdae]|nr:hypothetical protein EAJ15_06355 [Parabacteroides merdae]
MAVALLPAIQSLCVFSIFILYKLKILFCQNDTTIPCKSDYYPIFLELLWQVIFFNVSSRH